MPTEHFARVVREDPERPDLLFAGMERALLVSFDGGANWRSLQTNLPIVPITDLLVRQNDLVLATQGRAFWVIDDIAPLRQFETEHEAAAVHLYQPSTAYRLTPTQGRNGGGESFAPSAPNGVVVYYTLGAEADLGQSGVALEILDATGSVVLRRLETDPDVGVDGGGAGVGFALPAKQGLNRAVWDLRVDPDDRSGLRIPVRCRTRRESRCRPSRRGRSISGSHDARRSGSRNRPFAWIGIRRSRQTMLKYAGSSRPWADLRT